MSKDVNALCAACSQKCKQAATVKIVMCNRYEKAPLQLTLKLHPPRKGTANASC